MAAAGGSTTLELDFFRMERETNFAKPPSDKLFERKRSFRDIQGVISKINPEVVKAVIASSSVNAVCMENCDVQSPKAKKKHPLFSSPLPLYNPIYSCPHQTGVETAPMTIFYNGAVTVFDVPHQQAKNILKVAEEAAESIPDIKPNLFAENGGLPLTRRKSLRKFLEKRKQRQTNTVSPYSGIPGDALPSQNASVTGEDEEKNDEDIKE